MDKQEKTYKYNQLYKFNLRIKWNTKCKSDKLNSNKSVTRAKLKRNRYIK